MNKQIKMVDLHRQYVRYKNEIDDALNAVIESSAFVKGGKVDEFEAALSAYLNVKHVIACANGTDALTLSLMSLDLSPGDEIITSPFSFAATPESIAFLGLKPVFADINPHTFAIQPSEIERVITHNSKAIIPVHLFGQCADMESILKIATLNKLTVIEDACQSIGADIISTERKQKCATIGEMGCFSFFPSKNLGAFGDGGAICCTNDDLAIRLRMMANHGSKKAYQNEIIGINSRLDALQAAILLVKLKYYPIDLERRRAVAQQYSDRLSDIEAISLPQIASYSTHVFNQYTLIITDGSRDELQQYLLNNRISTAIYYPKPLHLQKAYQYLGYKKGDLPIAEAMSENVISLPISPDIEDNEIDTIAETIRKFYHSK